MNEYLKGEEKAPSGTRLKLKIEEVSFKELVNHSLKHLRMLDGAHKIKVQTTIEGCLPFFGDREQMQIIFNSLISNAIKYRHPHELNPTLIIHVEVDGAMARMSFQDNGRGIAKPYRSKVFEMCFRIPGTREEGAGLGLYMARELVKKMKGKIRVCPDCETGTRILLEIPNRIDPDYLRKLSKVIQNG